MTVGELIKQLSAHNPDLQVFLSVSDEFGDSAGVEALLAHRVVDRAGPYVEVIG